MAGAYPSFCSMKQLRIMLLSLGWDASLSQGYPWKYVASTHLYTRVERGGDRGAGDREKRGREVYGRREKRGREAGFPRWREAGEKGKNYAALCNILQSKKCKGVGAKKCRAGTGIKGYRKREV